MGATGVQLAFEDWPTADREAWHALFCDGDVFDGRGSALHWRAATRKTNQKHYARWLAWLNTAGAMDRDVEPWHRVTSERVTAYARAEMTRVAPKTVASALIGLKCVIINMNPDIDWTWLRDVTNRLKVWAKPVRARQDRILPANEMMAAVLAELDQLGELSSRSCKSDLAFRDALVIAILLCCPIRLKNLTTIHLGQHLQRICKERIESEGWALCNCYSDHAVSGASLLRPGIQMLLSDAIAGKFDVIIAEALDRLSRDQEDIAGVFKRLMFAGVKIITVSEGEINHLHIGLKGTMNALFLKDLADKTRRGLRGRVEAGKSGGGNAYGYDVVKSFDGAGEPVRGDRVINAQEAGIVVRIFADYAAGKSPKAIAAQLNREGISGPLGATWGQSTINGNRQRGTGILNNELYIGRLVWNRLRYLKDPTTGKRISRLNDPSAWVVHAVPDLRIVDQDLWDLVKARQTDLRGKKNSVGGMRECRRPRYLVSGLIKCGHCGGGYSVISQTHLGCSTARNKGTCNNLRGIKREVLEEYVLGGLRHHLMDPDLAKIFAEEYARHLNTLRQSKNALIEHDRAELAKVISEQDKLVDAICDGVPATKLKDRMIALEHRQHELEHKLATATEDPVLIHPNMGKVYRQKVGNLAPLSTVKTRVQRRQISCVV